jgi:hypothetical protein
LIRVLEKSGRLEHGKRGRELGYPVQASRTGRGRKSEEIVGSLARLLSTAAFS